MSGKTVAVLKALKENKGQTAKELGVSRQFVATLVKGGMITDTGTRKHTDAEGKATRGRPSNEYGLSKKGRDALRRHEAREAKAAQESQSDRHALDQVTVETEAVPA